MLIVDSNYMFSSSVLSELIKDAWLRTSTLMSYVDVRHENRIYLYSVKCLYQCFFFLSVVVVVANGIDLYSQYIK